MAWTFITTTRDVIRALLRLESIMSEVTEAMASMKADLTRIRAELVDRFDKLEAQLAASGKLTPEDQAALDDVRATIESIDELAPPLEQPAEPEQPAELTDPQEQ